MADLGLIGKGPSIGVKGTNVPSYWTGDVVGRRSALASITFKDVNRAAAPGFFRPLGRRGGTVPSFWTTVNGRSTRQGSISFVAGSAAAPRAYQYRSIAVRSVTVPSYWTGATLGQTRTISANSFTIPSYWTLVRGRTTGQGVISYAAGSAALPRAYQYRSIAVRSVTVPLYWTLVRGARTNQTIPSFRNTNIAAAPGIFTLNGVRAITGINAPTAGLVFDRSAIGVRSFTVPLYWTLVRGTQPVQTVPNFRITNTSAAPGYTFTYGANARSVGFVPSGALRARTGAFGAVASTTQYKSVTMYMRKTGTAEYGVRFDMGYSDTLVTMLSNNLPLASGVYIGPLLGTQTLRSQINGRYINVFTNGELQHTFVDTRATAIDVADAPGAVGFASNTCVDDFKSNTQPTLLLEDFESGLGNYSVGNPASYAIEAAPHGGNWLRCTTVSSNATRILPAAVVPTTLISLRFAMTGTIGISTPAVIRLRDTGGVDKLLFDIRTASDTFRKPSVTIDGRRSTLLGPPFVALSSGVNYLLTIGLAPVTSVVTITNLDNNTVYGTGVVPTPSLGALSIQQIVFTSNSIVTFFDDITII